MLMFNLEQELQNRRDIVAERDLLLEEKHELETKLDAVNASLESHDYAEIDNEITEILGLIEQLDKAKKIINGEPIEETDIVATDGNTEIAVE